MAHSVLIDEELLKEAVQASGAKNEEETVREALSEYIRARGRQALIDLFGTIDYDPDYDYKAERMSKRKA